MKFEALPSTVVPKVYDLTVDSDLVSLTFKGKVEVEVEVNQVWTSKKMMITHAISFRFLKFILQK